MAQTLARDLFRKLYNHPGLAAGLGAFLALMGQQAFNKIFEAGYAIAAERVQFPMLAKQIEYYRHIPDPCTPQLRNTIEDLNARIEYEHEANRQRFRLLQPWGPLIDYASTDLWNDIKPIKLHCGGKQ